MAAAIATRFDFGPPGAGMYKRGVIISLLFHAAIFIGIPVFLAIIKNTVRFERPQTFQLVAAPPSLRPFTPAVSKKLSKELAQRKVKKESTTQVPKEGGKAEENVEELASMLDELPQPARVAAVGDVKFNPYFAEVQQKIEQYWTPPSENRNISVVVAFTIFADGSISEPQIEKGSGNASLDEMALRAVRLAAPFRKLPLSVAADKKDFICTLIPVRK